MMRVAAQGLSKEEVEMTPLKTSEILKLISFRFRTTRITNSICIGPISTMLYSCPEKGTELRRVKR